MSVVSLLSFRIRCKTIKHGYSMKLKYNSIGGLKFLFVSFRDYGNTLVEDIFFLRVLRIILT